MVYRIPYGEKELKFSLPDHWRVVSVAEPKKVDQIAEIQINNVVRESFLNPIGTEPLNKLLKPSDKVVIVVNDISRPTPSSLLVKPLIDFLINTVNLPVEDIQIIFGLGVHREMTEIDVKKKLGTNITNQVSWENHNCYDNLVDLKEKSSFGTPILVNKTYIDADFTIAIGLIEPHLWAGYSGGYKAIIPGIVGVHTIVHNHHLLMKKNVQVGKIKNNPFRQDIEEVGKRIGLNFIINCVMNHNKKICEIFSGDPSSAFQEGVEYARSLYEIPIKEQSDVVIAGAAPLGIDFRQSGKACMNTQSALKNGGVMIVISECPEGIGNLRLSEKPPKRGVIKALSRYLPAKMLMKVITKQNPGVEDSSSLFQMFKFLSRKNYIFLTENLTEEERRKLSVADHVTTIEEAFIQADKILGNEKKKKPVKVTIFPFGGCSYPRLTS
ncbi:MAG: nickel-dependent lactate racemase [Promethearchaeota archaeon]